MRTAILGFAAGAACLLSGASAQELGAAVDVSGGTTGVSAHAQVGVTDWLALRGGYNWLDYSAEDEEYDGILFDGDLEFSGFGGFADLHPFKNGFTVTGGLFVGDKAVHLDATPQEPVDIGGRVFAPSEVGTLTGDAQFADTAGFAGLGWDRSLYKPGRLSLILRAGVMFAGDSEVSLDATGLATVDPVLAQELRDRLELEERELEDDIDKYAYWPVLTIGLGYRF
ncbi:hypothetical protein [Parvularcula oceani]|uniref:hypothetical protein n=1 Tax=Parvularcula oceani TaxID=1247963 RepID=UPI0004E1DE8F|nr:hypothetical protein [Parvularcula oceani]